MAAPTRYLALLAAAALLLSPHPFAAAGVKLRAVTGIYHDGAGVALRAPDGVATDGKTHLVVADAGNGRLVPFDVSGTAVTPGTPITIPELPYPVRVQIDSGGGIWALDGKLRRIARLGPKGDFLGYFEPSDEGGGAFVPRGFKLVSGEVYVLDVGTGAVIVAKPDGSVDHRIVFPEKFGFMSDLAVDARGTVYLIDSVGARLYVAARDDAAFRPLTGSLREDMNFSTGIVVDDSGHLLVADQNGGGIVIFGTDGTFRGRQSGYGWKEGFLRYPSELALGGGRTLFVADRANNRVQVFSVAE